MFFNILKYRNYGEAENCLNQTLVLDFLLLSVFTRPCPPVVPWLLFGTERCVFQFLGWLPAPLSNNSKVTVFPFSDSIRAVTLAPRIGKDPW